MLVIWFPFLQIYSSGRSFSSTCLPPQAVKDKIITKINPKDKVQTPFIRDILSAVIWV